MRMSGAVLSTGWRATVTLQYSPTTAAPVPDGATTAASVTWPPVVGRPMAAAGTATPVSPAQRVATSAALAGAAQPSAAMTARVTPATAVLDLIGRMGRVLPRRMAAWRYRRRRDLGHTGGVGTGRAHGAGTHSLSSGCEPGRHIRVGCPALTRRPAPPPGRCGTGRVSGPVSCSLVPL